MFLRTLCTKDLLKRVYKLEPSSVQKLSSIGMLPNALKFLIGIFVDLKIVSKRKYLLGWFGLLSFLCQAFMCCSYVDYERKLMIPFTLNTLCVTIMDATIESYSVQ